ncbi:4-hydroxybenzoate polyprenyl transferase family protein [Biscogniauxia mediterranea]|nr:4-hydroxybenzoate polyprenyl transferase family protein [Biscogniauxia mediterranea]
MTTRIITGSSPRSLSRFLLFSKSASPSGLSRWSYNAPRRISHRTQATIPTRASLGLTKPKSLLPLSPAPNHHNNRRTTHTISSPPPPRSPSAPEEPYTPPTTGILSYLPASWVPYGELVRLDKPTGTYYLFFPCLFSTLLAAPLAGPPAADPLSVAGTSLLFFVGALVMRGAGCSINDLWDRDLDPRVARTRHRPLARGAISPRGALAWTGAQLLAGLAVLLQFPPACLWYGVPSLALVAAYPLAKRVTYYPQAVLGLTFSWGAVMGFPALGVDLLADAPALAAAALLYASNVAWTVLYDMIYAHMDIRDDAKAGIKSIALKHDADTKKVLAGLAVVQIGLLGGAGIAAGAGPVFFIGSCGGAALTLGWMIKRVNLKSVKDCWWWFVNGCWITGGVISLGLGADYIVRYVRDDHHDESRSIQEQEKE